MGWVGFIMNAKTEIEVAVIPKGSKIQIMGCSYTLLEDVRVNGKQGSLDAIIEAQKEYEEQPKANGCGIKSSTT